MPAHDHVRHTATAVTGSCTVQPLGVGTDTAGDVAGAVVHPPPITVVPAGHNAVLVGLATVVVCSAARRPIGSS